MNRTSLHSIDAKDPLRLEQMQINKLFTRNNYPHFELSDLKKKPQLLKRQLYTSFLKVLEEWNQLVDDPNQQIHESHYKRNEFIFSWLKWLVVQNTKFIDSSLIRLQNWYNTSRLKQPTISMHSENQQKAYAEQWEIRNSYRSNLPLQIDNYRRRALFNIRSVCNTPQAARLKQNVRNDNEAKGLKIVNQAKRNEKDNAFLRTFRQEQQIKDYFNSFRKSKIQFYTNLAKNYSKTQFSRDKLSLTMPQLADKANKSALFKDFRIKTTIQGFRHFQRDQSLSQNKTAIIDFNQTKNSSFFNSNLYQTYSNTPSETKSLIMSNIDGLSLLVNPFESKLKKKRRN